MKPIHELGSIGIEVILKQLARIAWQARLDPRVQMQAVKLTDHETGRQNKIRALVDELHRRFAFAPSPATQDRLDEEMRREIDPSTVLNPSCDADDACVFVAAAAMSVGIPCQFVGVRYGHSWTCWLRYQVEDSPTASCVASIPAPRWETIDPLRQRKPDREPDEQVLGPGLER